MALSHRLKVKSQCDLSSELSLGEDPAKGFKRHLCLVRPPVLMAISFHVNFLYFLTTDTILTLEESVSLLSGSEYSASLILIKEVTSGKRLVCYCNGTVIHLVPLAVIRVFANTLYFVQ